MRRLQGFSRPKWRGLGVLVFVVFGWPRAGLADERRGCVVVARTPQAEPAAKELARAIYREPSLRPRHDEMTVRAVLGETLSADAPAAARELARVARAAVEAADPAIGLRLFRSLGGDLGVATLAVVEAPLSVGAGTLGDVDAGPSARVFIVAEGRFLPLTFTPRRGVSSRPGAAPSSEGVESEWSDAVAFLRQLSAPQAAPLGASVPVASVREVAAPPRDFTASRRPAKEPGQSSHPWLSSPWFWGSLGAVVAVGATVLVLSQTALKPAETVVLEGRIVP